MRRTWPKLSTVWHAFWVWCALLALLALLLVTMGAAAAGELKITATSFPPGQELRPGVTVLLSVSELPEDESPVWHLSEIEGDLFVQVGKQYLFAGVAEGPRTIVVQIPAKGEDPFAVVTFHYGEQDADPPVPPLPGKVAGVLILEEQHDRTASQRRVMDDPTWQAAAKAAGLTWRIFDDDSPAPEVAAALTATAASKLEVPVVCSIDGAGNVIDVRPLPESVEAMRELIGGLK